MTSELRQYKELKYIVTLPDDYTEGKKYPAILFLHGAGTLGDKDSLLRGQWFLGFAEKYSHSFVTFIPHCRKDDWFGIFEQLKDFAQAASEMPFVEKERFVLSGASMGGYGCWELGISRPDLFSCIVPICGGGMAWETFRLKDTPVWAFHGENDEAVSVEESKRMVEGVNRNGGNARLTIFPNTDHNAWVPAFEKEELWDWMLSQRKDI